MTIDIYMPSQKYLWTEKKNKTMLGKKVFLVTAIAADSFQSPYVEVNQLLGLSPAGTRMVILQKACENSNHLHIIKSSKLVS